MPHKNKRQHPERITKRVVGILVVIILSGIIGGQTEIGFSGMLMVCGAILTLMGSYAEGGSPTERDRLSHIDEPLVIYGAPQSQSDESKQRPNALFSVMAIGMFLFVLGALIGLTGATFVTVMIIASIFTALGMVYAYRKQIFYRDALTQQPKRHRDTNEAQSIKKLSKSDFLDDTPMIADDDEILATDTMTRGR